MVLSVSTDGVAWQEIEGIVAARDSYFRGALHDGRRHVLVFTRELWVNEGDEAQAWRRVPVGHNSFLELTGDRLVAATPEGLMVRDAGALTFAESRPTRIARSLATNASWQAAGPAAVAERKQQEALAKAAADAIPPTVAGAVEMAKAFHHFERLYVSGAPRKDLAQQVVGVHEAVRKHRPRSPPPSAASPTRSRRPGSRRGSSVADRPPPSGARTRWRGPRRCAPARTSSTTARPGRWVPARGTSAPTPCWRRW